MSVAPAYATSPHPTGLGQTQAPSEAVNDNCHLHLVPAFPPSAHSRESGNPVQTNMCELGSLFIRWIPGQARYERNEGKVTNILNGAITGDNRTYGYDASRGEKRAPASDREIKNARWTSSSGPWGSGTYSYDALGNVRTKTEGGRALVMSYDSKNRLASHTDTGGPNRMLNYDARGNVTQLGGLFFTYDRSDQPTYISGTASGTYRYDGHNRRVKAVVDGKTIYNVYDASGTLVHIDAVTDGKKTDYIGKFVRIKTENGTDTPTYLHMDHLGSAQTGTSQNGTVAWREQYTPFGETMTNPLGNADLAGYTGHIKDSATGLNYMQARYYDPLIGRFLSIDPVGFSVDMPFMFNRYTYVNNDPLNLWDPTGEAAVGFRVEGQAVVGGGGKFSVEISVDFETGEIRASGSVGKRVGLRGQGSVEGFVEPSSKQGNSLSGKGVVSAEASAEFKTPIGTGNISSSAEFGAGTDGLVLPNSDALLDVSGNFGPVTVDENGRASIGIGGGLGGSAGTEYTIEGSFSIPDTIDAAKGLVENIREKFE